jgi:hypothetical protein
MGYHGWLIAQMDNMIRIEGVGATYGHIDDVTCYRAELCVNIVNVTVLAMTVDVYGFKPPCIEHICDNQSAITATLKNDNSSISNKQNLMPEYQKFPTGRSKTYKDIAKSTHAGKEVIQTKEAHPSHCRKNSIFMPIPSPKRPRLNYRPTSNHAPIVYTYPNKKYQSLLTNARSHPNFHTT